MFRGYSMEKILYKLDDFELYKLARQFRKRVYGVIRQLPSEEKYALDPPNAKGGYLCYK